MAAKQQQAAPPKRTVDGGVLMNRLDNAFELKLPWIPILREMYSLTMAARNPYDPLKTSMRALDCQFDSTAPMSLFKATNRLMSELVPPDQNWVDLDMGPVLANKLDDQTKQQVKKQLTSTTTMTQVVFSGGNFINAIWETFMEMLGGIMGCLLVLEDPDDDIEPVNFECVPQSEVAIEKNGKGKNCGVYRKRTCFKIRNIKDTWSDAVLPPELAKKLDDAAKNKNKKDPECDLMESSYLIPKSGGKWAYTIHWRQEKQDPVEVVYREYDENPWIIFQWSKLPGSPYGPGPGIMLLPAIRMVNKVREMLIMNAALALAGMYLAKDDGVLNIDNIQIVQGGIIPVGSTGGSGGAGASLAPLQTGRDFNIAQIVLEEEQDTIRKGLFDNGLPDPSKGVRSPTEIMERVRELAQDIGGAIGRMTRSLVELVARVIGILTRRGLVPKITLDQFTFKVHIKSPLARAAQMQEVQTALQWYQMVQSLVGQQMSMMFVDVEEMIQWIADRLGIPDNLLRDDVDKQQIQQGVSQIIAAAQMQSGMQAPPAASMGAPA